MSLILFVGGNNDGARLEIPDQLELVYCPDSLAYERQAVEDWLGKEQEGIPKQLYRKITLQAGGAYFQIFKYEGITDAQVMQSLILGYTFTWKRKE